ncbi:DUF3265 domain-containing protein [Vibrio parahaemolyticus]|nr:MULTISPECIES: DUF3265 domain-containing protein [Vibrio]MDS1833238.1 DUF3265 domain-containing protein [Vibrio vulnificus]MDU9596129.1 DUF3265 domain-containing protein [Vibrio sp. 2-1-2a]MDU9605316.1 DUF3265 domain-containing protein [Vibrio sp. 1-2-3a]EGQ8518319.1 DUF3265 domain-containing protein [Vibrio parahaemolyticus]MBE3752967.1 DUF3265 domain-containing protein [Vibrio parahaemolyticus]
MEVAHVLTNCLRVIRNAWHFYYAVAYVIKVLCGSFCIALLTP